ncbi:hypothetical protein HC733_10450 [Pseudoalteromonas sp. S16_S37]|nr:hypothetical protein [Pseudoalteromonas sp. S16_S37]
MKMKTLVTALAIVASSYAVAEPEMYAPSGTGVNYDFRIGLQAFDDRGRDAGRVEYTQYLSSGSSTETNWVVDRDAYDPDALKLHLSILRNTPVNKDFRLAIRAADNSGRGGYGYWQYTPWASEGGGWSGFALDSDGYDPDAFKIRIETRNWQEYVSLRDFRIGLKVADDRGREEGSATFTPWASQGGGWTSLATDDDAYDFDGFAVSLEVRKY